MKSQIQVITVPTADTPGTAVAFRLSSSKKRYLLGNLSEGIQRATVETGGSLRNISDTFLTGRSEWHNTGGLIGTLLTMSDARGHVQESGQGTTPLMNLHGATNLKQTIATCRRFVFRKHLPLLPYEYKPSATILDAKGNIQPSWSDENIRVWAIPIEPSQASQSSSEILSTRERGYDEALGWNPDEKASVKADKYETMRDGIIADMFNSDWRVDALIEGPLKEVQMPAQIFVRDPATKSLKIYNGPKPGDGKELPEIMVLTRKPWPAALVKQLPPTQPSTCALSYIVRTHPQRGKFNPKKAKELGLTDAKQYKTLTQGGSLTNDKGEVITSDMVLEAGNSGSGFAIVELPGQEYVEPLISREEWRSDFVMENVRRIIWILAPGVLAHSSLQDFLRRLHVDRGIINHVASADTMPNNASFHGAALQGLKLSKLDPKHFVEPHSDSSTPQEVLQPRDTETMSPVEEAGIDTLRRSCEYGIDELKESSLTVHQLEDLSKTDIPQAALRLADHARAQIKKDAGLLQKWASEIPNPETEVISLGTGSALPSKYRNVSATLVRVPGRGSYLFDAGENTMGQMQRAFGAEGTRKVLQDLKLIWISHMHADHHLGTASVIRAWRDTTHGKPTLEKSQQVDDTAQGSSPRLAVVSDAHMIEWLQEYAEIENYGWSHLLPLSITSEEDLLSDEAIHQNLRLHSMISQPTPFSVEQLAAHTGLDSIRATSVNHCYGARAVSIAFPDNLKISYSGDCRPSQRFAAIGRDSTLLIHEATFDDELRGDAIAKKHSTTAEALMIGQLMRAKCVLLTHFSQRYSKFPMIERAEDGHEEATEEAIPVVELEDEAVPTEADTEVDATTSSATALEGMDIDPALPTTQVPPPDPSTRSPTASKFRLRNKDMKVGVAFDLMRVKLGEFAELEYFTPALSELFREEVDQMAAVQRKRDERNAATLESGAWNDSVDAALKKVGKKRASVDVGGKEQAYNGTKAEEKKKPKTDFTNLF